MVTARLRLLVRGALVAATAASSVVGIAGAGCNAETSAGESDAAATDGPASSTPGVVCFNDGSFASPDFSPAGPWTDAALCTGSPTIPRNPYTCCGVSFFVPLACVPPTLALDGGADAGVTLDCTTLCGDVDGSFDPIQQCALVVAPDGGTGVGCQTYGCLGQRPRGLCEDVTQDDGSVGAALCRAYALEAASVPAFRTLRAELRAHGAPKSLLRAASRAARDETRHARATKRLARRFGGAPRDPVIAATPWRDLEALAIENAVEGCTRELYGAVVARWQAEHASDPNVRAVMGRVAADELHHAALAMRVAAWVHARLAPTARDRVEASRVRAIDDLRAAVGRSAPRHTARVLGLPSTAQARAMLEALA